MKKTDIGVVGFMYAVCAFFFLMSRDLKKGARIYPLCIIAILFLLTTGYVVEMLFAAKKNGVTSGIPEIFEGFQPKQFFIVLGMLIAYLIGISDELKALKSLRKVAPAGYACAVKADRLLNE